MTQIAFRSFCAFIMCHQVNSQFEAVVTFLGQSSAPLWFGEIDAPHRVRASLVDSLIARNLVSCTDLIWQEFCLSRLLNFVLLSWLPKAAVFSMRVVCPELVCPELLPEFFGLCACLTETIPTPGLYPMFVDTTTARTPNENWVTLRLIFSGAFHGLTCFYLDSLIFLDYFLIGQFRSKEARSTRCSWHLRQRGGAAPWNLMMQFLPLRFTLE